MTFPPKPTRRALRVALAAGTPERDVAPLRRSASTMRDTPASSPAPYSPLPKLRRHVLAAGFAGEAVGDELLEVVADFDPHLSILDGQQDQQAVVLAVLADAAAAVLEHLHGVLADVAVRLERVDVATTTTSPLACCSERISASISAALSGSITLAKSLTGCVSAGGAGCAAATKGTKVNPQRSTKNTKRRDLCDLRG